MSFQLAPMTWDLRVCTWVALAIPAGLVLAARAGPPPVDVVQSAVAAFVCLLYVGVWLIGRPMRFEVDADALRIVWPVRARAIPRRMIGNVRLVTCRELRREYGAGMRIGAGGLWGGFGLLKTRTTTFSMWISRSDRVVVVDLAGARPLLVTPEDPERFVEALRS